IAAICTILQYFFGDQEQVPFVSSPLHPLAITILSPFTVNDALLCVLGLIIFMALLRIAAPFDRFDGTLLLLLALIFVPMQYSYGLTETRHILDNSNLSNQVFLNLLLFLVPLILAAPACCSLPKQLEWMRQLAVLGLALACAELQNFLGGREPFLLLASQVNRSVGALPHLSAFGQFLFYALGVAGAILVLRAF